MLKIIIGYYRKYKYVYFFALILAIVSIVLRNITPYAIKFITDSAINREYNKIYNYIFMLFGALVVSNLLNNISSYIQDITLAKVSVQTQKDIFKKLHDLDFEYYVERSSGSLISILKRGDGALWGIYFAIHDNLLDLVIAFIFLIISFSFIDIKYVYVAIIIFLLMIIFAYKLVQKNIRERILFNDKEDELSAIKVDNMINFETVKYFANEGFEQQKFSDKISEWYIHLKRFFTTFRYMDLFLGNIANVGLLTFFLMGYYDYAQEKITLGTYLLISSFAMSIFPRFWQLIRAFREIAKNQADLIKYFNILTLDSNVKDPIVGKKLDQKSYSVNFDNITFKYKNGDKALNDFNLDINKNESVALVGYSGAGKTTLVKLLLRFFDVNKGSIQLNNIDVKDLKKSDLRQIVGVVPQEPILFNDTIKYNLIYGKQDATVSEIENAAKLAQIHDFIMTMPKKYETLVGERGLKLSGGQKQRLAIARVILKNPKIVVFDEATSNLDSKSEQLIQEAFWGLAKEKTTIVIAHRLSTIMHADRIIVIDRGKVFESGTHQELLNINGGLYKKLWELQHDGFIGGE